jgi:muconolactone delta-isomerase
MSDDQDLNKSIDDYFEKQKRSSDSSALQIGFAVFIAIISSIALYELYEEYKIRQFTKALINSANSFNNEVAQMNERNRERLFAAQAESQSRMRELNAQNEARAKELQMKQYLDNYWKDVGNGTFINIGKSKRNGDLASALLKINNRQISVNINCHNSTYWSDQNNGWFTAPDSLSTEYRIIEIACSPKD